MFRPTLTIIRFFVWKICIQIFWAKNPMVANVGQNSSVQIFRTKNLMMAIVGRNM